MILFLFSFIFTIRVFSEDHPKEATIIAGGKKFVLKVRDNMLVVNNELKNYFILQRREQGYEVIVDTTKRRYKGGFIVYVYNGELFIINFVNEKEYLYSVVSSEMPGDAPYEALKAQAVVSRTYAYKNVKRHEGFDFCDGQHCQVYLGADVIRENAKKAVDETEGVVISFQNELADVYYHSTCGGHTIPPESLWESFEPKPYLTKVNDSTYCVKSPYYSWEKVFSVSEFLSMMGIEDVDSVKTKKSGEVVKKVIFYSADTIYEFSTHCFFRHIPGKLYTPTFSIEIEKDSVYIKGKGYGHRVGMCQWGAIGMAKEGKNYREIIGHYFPNTKLVNFFKLK